MVRFNKTGKYCMTCGHDRTIRLWNPHRSGVERAGDALLIKTYNGPHAKEVRDVCITQDNNRFASCGGDKSVFIWDVATGKVIKKYQGHDQQVNAVKFNKDDSVLVSAGYDRKICTWDLRAHAWTPIQTMSHSKDSITSLLVTDTLIIAGSVDGCIRTYDLRNGMVFTDDLHEAVTCVSMSNDGNCLLAGCLDSTVRLIEKVSRPLVSPTLAIRLHPTTHFCLPLLGCGSNYQDSGTLLNEYRGHKHESYPLTSCLSNCDAYVISGSEDGKVYAWDLVEGNVLQTIGGHTKVLTLLPLYFSLSPSPRPPSFTTLTTLPPHIISPRSLLSLPQAVSSVAYHPKEPMLVSVSHDGTGRVFR
jgi:mitogen-activated protein kinase organizer 1